MKFVLSTKARIFISLFNVVLSGFLAIVFAATFITMFAHMGMQKASFFLLLYGIFFCKQLV